MPTLEEMIRQAVEAGATHITLENLKHPDYDMPDDWHWDIYVGDPHHWHSIKKPWSIDFAWYGWKSNNPNKLFGFLPFDIWFYDYWTITTFGHADDVGCGLSYPPVSDPAALESFQSALEQITDKGKED